MKLVASLFLGFAASCAAQDWLMAKIKDAAIKRAAEHITNTTVETLISLGTNGFETPAIIMDHLNPEDLGVKASCLAKAFDKTIPIITKIVDIVAQFKAVKSFNAILTNTAKDFKSISENHDLRSFLPAVKKFFKATKSLIVDLATQNTTGQDEQNSPITNELKLIFIEINKCFQKPASE